MKYDHDRKWVRRVLKTADIANTLNGGISESRVELEKKSDHYLMKAMAPGVSVHSLKVEVIDKTLLVYHNLQFKGTNGFIMLVPHVIASYPLAPGINFNNISATVEGRQLNVFMPFTDLNTGFV